METAHRKVTTHIHFTDEQGNPLSNRKITVRQTNHAFLFGCGAFEFVEVAARGNEEFRKFTDSWLEIFNYGTLPFY